MRRLAKIMVTAGLGLALLSGAAAGVANAETKPILPQLVKKDAVKGKDAGKDSGPENNSGQDVGGGAGTGGLINTLNEAIS